MTVHYTGFYVTGEESYTGDNMSELVLSLVDKANRALPKWEQIRMDADGEVYAYDESPTKEGCAWDFEGVAKKIGILSNELRFGLNWQTFGIIRTDTDTQDAPEPKIATLSEHVCESPHIEQPERTIADIVTIAENSLTIDHIRAIADLHPTAQAYMVTAIANGKIMLQ